MDDIVNFISWYFIITIIGLLAFPISYRIFKFLPDRGFALTRPVGLLIFSYIFWLFASLQIIPNNFGGALLSLSVVLIISLLAIRGIDKQEIITWIKSKSRYITIAEVLFFITFLVWSIVRSVNPDITGTEKPMELAFINAILRSSTFPPHDPWLSGYSISYYYFGYIMVALLARLSNISGPVAFNLAISSWFALTALAAYGIGYSLLSLKLVDWDQQSSKLNILSDRKNSFFALLTPLFILVVSNIEGFLEVLHSLGLFWEKTLTGDWVSNFWSWINIQELSVPPVEPFTWIPKRVGGIWWWRASRVLQDFNILDQSKEIIDEFPFFSYFLADLHPHVLAMPFALVAIGLALNIFWGGFHIQDQKANTLSGIINGYLQNENGLTVNFFYRWIKSKEFWLGAFFIGSFLFLNTWDYPIYLLIYCCALMLPAYYYHGWNKKFVSLFLVFLFTIFFGSIVLFLPFFISFASQAGGILPSISFYTRGIYFVVMFLPFLFPLFVYLIWMNNKNRNRKALINSTVISVSLLGLLWGLSFILGFIILKLNDIGNFLQKVYPYNVGLFNLGHQLIDWSSLFAGLHGSGDAGLLLGESFIRRTIQPGTWLILSFMLILTLYVFTYIHSLRKTYQNNQSPGFEATNIRNAKLDLFIILLIIVGILLTLAPEFIYLRDQFGWRMNTIFKFYYQTWIIWAIAAAYAVVLILRGTKIKYVNIIRIGFIVILVCALVYPFFGLRSKFLLLDKDDPNQTLDGSNYLKLYSPDEWEAIFWLQDAPYGIVAEAVGGSYSSYARVSTYSGLPTVLGWPGHESQWRGGAAEMGSREADIKRLYQTGSWDEAQEIIVQYDIDYIYIGDLEQSKYKVNSKKFDNNLTSQHTFGDVSIYEVSQLE